MMAGLPTWSLILLCVGAYILVVMFGMGLCKAAAFGDKVDLGGTEVDDTNGYKL